MSGRAARTPPPSPDEPGRDPEASAPARRSPAALGLLAAASLVAVAVLVGLGTWQLHRLSWKLDLIARVDARVHAAPVPPPGPAAWAGVTPADDAYRHVTVRGTYLAGHDALVQAVTDLGGGYWDVVPFRTDLGFTLLVNRGFVPPERSTPPPPEGEVAVTGLLRVSEPGGAFLRSNDPRADRWYSRDVAAIAAAKGVGPVAPYFIDADAAPNPGGWPVGGLTVVAFPNSHLVYALTWYALALSLAGAVVWVARDEVRLRRGSPQGRGS